MMHGIFIKPTNYLCKSGERVNVSLIRLCLGVTSFLEESFTAELVSPFSFFFSLFLNSFGIHRKSLMLEKVVFESKSERTSVWQQGAYNYNRSYQNKRKIQKLIFSSPLFDDENLCDC
jgi:hypothetical protein